MNRNTLEAYAQKARRDFIAAVTGRAAFYGLTAKTIEPVVEQGDVTMIGAHAFPRNVADPRKRLEERIQQDGFEQVMEAIAYTWFNRFAAIRYMELHGYLDHGYRVLSHPEGRPYPEILEHAADVDLPNFDREKAVELKLDGSKDEELYRLLLKAQCNALHQAMPFLFERIGDETELLLPANLLHTDSLIHRMVESIDESAWGQIEIIGWLYQFYISEKKDQVIGNVVASEDIPAATQLFTPNWIVKYLVQNSLGAQWLATYPHSQLSGKMEYYIKPAEQTDEVKAQLAAITPGTLNPEALTLIDPASGSGHILVEAYDLFKAIYLERGYRQRDVAQLILEKNLFGLDIDGRAAQLTGFALMMKGRADDRRLFERGVELNVMSLVDSKGFDAERLAQSVKLSPTTGLVDSDLTELKRLFEHASTFGSLIQVPEGLAAKLPALKQLSEATSQDLFVSDALTHLAALVRQAEMLAGRIRRGGRESTVYGKQGHECPGPEEVRQGSLSRREERPLRLLSSNVASRWRRMQAITPWSPCRVGCSCRRSKAMRTRLCCGRRPSRQSAHLGARAFGHLGRGGSDSGHVCLQNRSLQASASAPSGSDGGKHREKQAIRRIPMTEKRFSNDAQDEFKKIPGSPVAYWVSERVREVFEEGTLLGKLVDAKQGPGNGRQRSVLAALA